MKRFFTIMLLMAMATLSSCNRHKVISEQELGAIFHDAMLVNAYIGVEEINIDSLNIYEPIFEKYGYTTEDMRYTINNFSRRKNARLGDVADYMIEQFDNETKALRREVAILDTINNVADRRFKSEVARDTAIVVKNAADSVKLFHYVPIKGKGVYDIALSYTVDEDDNVRGRRILIHRIRRDSSKHLLYQSQLQLNRKTNVSTRQKIEEQDSIFVAFLIEMSDRQRVNKADRKKITRMTIHEIKAEYQPETEDCVRMLFDEQINVRIFSDSMIRSIEKTLAAGPASKTERAEETAEK